MILDAHAQPHHPPVQAVARLLGAGISVSLDARHAWAHDKVMILDGAIVITGSSNWTVAAEQENGENLLVIRDPRLARVHTENWRHHASDTTPYRAMTPWWVRIRVVWGSLARRRPARMECDIGEDGCGASREARRVMMGAFKKQGCTGSTTTSVSIASGNELALTTGSLTWYPFGDNLVTGSGNSRIAQVYNNTWDIAS